MSHGTAERSPWEAALGDAVSQLHPRLRAYFSPIPAGHVGRGRGTFDVVGTPRRWLWPALWVLGLDGVVFPVWERDVAFTVENRWDGGILRAARTFHFRGGIRVMTDAMTSSAARCWTGPAATAGSRPHSRCCGGRRARAAVHGDPSQGRTAQDAPILLAPRVESSARRPPVIYSASHRSCSPHPSSDGSTSTPASSTTPSRHRESPAGARGRERVHRPVPRVRLPRARRRGAAHRTSRAGCGVGRGGGHPSRHRWRRPAGEHGRTQRQLPIRAGEPGRDPAVTDRHHTCTGAPSWPQRNHRSCGSTPRLRRSTGTRRIGR